MIAAVDIGNRVLTCGIFDPEDNGTPRAVFRVSAEETRTSDEYAAIFSGILSQKAPGVHVDGAIIASVYPAMTATVCRTLSDLFGEIPIQTVGAGLRTGFTIRTDAPGELGADLVANASGAMTHIAPPFLILDCGTAITLSAVTAGKESPCFVGCCILSGVTVEADALSDRTAQLSSVALRAPQHAIGTGTSESICSGVLFGKAAAVDALIERFEGELEAASLPVIATGEEAPMLLPHCKRQITYERDLTLQGLYRLWKINRRRTN